MYFYYFIKHLRRLLDRLNPTHPQTIWPVNRYFEYHEVETCQAIKYYPFKITSSRFGPPRQCSGKISDHYVGVSAKNGLFCYIFLIYATQAIRTWGGGASETDEQLSTNIVQPFQTPLRQPGFNFFKWYLSLQILITPPCRNYISE